ncbi:MAG: hypothetical protein HKN29_03310 [Rhodothermales bacterium]|nr:hypothetical protein [Rhodothermales bacterium]
MTVFDIIGLVGVAFIVGAYLLLQTGRIASENPWFSVANALGAGLVLVSLWYEFNLSAAVVEGFWLVMSLYGIVRSLRKRRSVSADGQDSTDPPA